MAKVIKRPLFIKAASPWEFAVLFLSTTSANKGRCNFHNQRIWTDNCIQTDWTKRNQGRKLVLILFAAPVAHQVWQPFLFLINLIQLCISLHASFNNNCCISQGLCSLVACPTVIFNILYICMEVARSLGKQTPRESRQWSESIHLPDSLPLTVAAITLAY